MSLKIFQDAFTKAMKEKDFSQRDDFNGVKKEKAYEPRFSSTTKTNKRTMPGQHKSREENELSDLWDDPSGCGSLENKGIGGK